MARFLGDDGQDRGDGVGCRREQVREVDVFRTVEAPYEPGKSRLPRPFSQSLRGSTGSGCEARRGPPPESLDLWLGAPGLPVSYRNLSGLIICSAALKFATTPSKKPALIGGQAVPRLSTWLLTFLMTVLL